MKFYYANAWTRPFFAYPKIYDGSTWNYGQPLVWDGLTWDSGFTIVNSMNYYQENDVGQGSNIITTVANGYNPNFATVGSIDHTTFIPGSNILVFYEYQRDNNGTIISSFTEFQLSGNVAQNYFTNAIITNSGGSKTLTSASATYTYSSNISTWQWNSYGVPNLTNNTRVTYN
jgi:hypothetical protein